MARMTGTIKQLRAKGVGVLAASDGTEYSFDQTAAGENRCPARRAIRLVRSLSQSERATRRERQSVLSAGGWHV